MTLQSANDMPSAVNASALRTPWSAIILLAASLALFLLLRLPHVGHLLLWDEAMELCSVRTWTSGGGDFTTAALWWHPPGFKVLLRALSPLQEGFAERAQILAVCIALLNATLLFILNRRTMGITAAVASVFFIAVSPGAVFYDVLVKQDGPAVTFGIVALLMLTYRRPLYAGLAIGFSLLFKETGAFYAIAALLLWLSGLYGRRTWKDLAALVLTPAATCSWWYLAVQPAVTGTSVNAQGIGAWFSSVVQRATVHLSWASHAGGGWERPWHYYLTLLPNDLGATGLILSIAGVFILVVSATSYRRGRTTAGNPDYPCVGFMFWPVALIIPGFLILTFFSNKVPWVTIVFFPGWVSLQAFALASALRLTQHAIPGRLLETNPRIPNLVNAGIVALIAVTCISPLADLSHEEALGRMDMGQLVCSRHSLDAAEMTDRFVDPHERLLLSSFYHWYGLPPGHPCALWAWYTRSKPEVVIFPYQTPFCGVTNLMEQFKPDWVLVSPLPGKAKAEMTDGFRSHLQLQPAASTRTAILYRVRKSAAAK